MSRTKKGVKKFSPKELALVRVALRTMAKNGVVFLDKNSSLKMDVSIKGKVVFNDNSMRYLSEQALMQRANPAIKYKK